MTDSTLTLNNNAAQCIKSTTQFGQDIYYNICNNVPTVTVPWGGVDWLLLIGLGIIIGAMFMGLLALIRAVLFE